MSDLKLIALTSESRKWDKEREYLNKYLEAFNGIFSDVMIVRGTEDLDAVAKELGGSPVVVLAPLSGGTSYPMIKLAEGRRLAVILTHGLNNSLPSGIKAKAYLERRGTKVRLFHGLTPEARRYLENLRDAVSVSRKLSGRKLLLMATDDSLFRKYGIDPSKLEELGIRVEFVPLEDTVSMFQSAKPHGELMERFSKFAEGEIGEEDIRESSKVRTIIEEAVEKAGATDVGFRCFPFIMRTGVTPCLALSSLIDDGVTAGCEADAPATLAMMIFRALGVASFMGNVEDVSDDGVLLAHCTVATSLVRKLRLMRHFETGLSVAIRGEFPEERVTVLAISSDFRKMVVGSGIARPVSEHSDEMCRTQVVVSLSKPCRLLEGGVSGHLVVAPGDHTGVLKAFAEIHGMEVVEI